MDLTPGAHVELAIEKPAARGQMIARHEGRVVFVLGAIPGERVLARVDRIERQFAFATVTEVIEPSPDRREPFVDPMCGGCLYAHLAYPAQVRMKAAVIRDAFSRLGRLDLPEFEVEPSQEFDYRMRGRLHVQGSEVGFYREGSRTLCDAAATRQLSADAVAAGMEAVRLLQHGGVPVDSVLISENIAADQRALHVETREASVLQARLREVVDRLGVRGCSALSGGRRVMAGDPSVADPMATLTSGRAATGTLARRAESFFQGNRFLLPSLVSAVLDAVRKEGSVAELYAGVGLFSLALAATGREQITAVEGDRSSGADLLRNASAYPGAVRAVVASVEEYLRTPPADPPHVVIVDPPRSGISKDAMQAVVSLGAAQVVYVSCDPPTMARDARRLLEGGYGLRSIRAFDLFPNTPHVEVLGIFDRR